MKIFQILILPGDRGVSVGALVVRHTRVAEGKDTAGTCSSEVSSEQSPARPQSLPDRVEQELGIRELGILWKISAELARVTRREETRRDILKYFLFVQYFLLFVLTETEPSGLLDNPNKTREAAQTDHPGSPVSSESLAVLGKFVHQGRTNQAGRSDQT